MVEIAADRSIYHIVHIDNLRSIIADRCLWSDAFITQRGQAKSIGMDAIKRRRLTLPVSCHPGKYVGDFVPFYFCPRSIMLYVIYCGNDPDLRYRGGQEPIIHLQSNLIGAVDWAEEQGKRWAYSTANAGAHYADFGSRRDGLSDINWKAVNARHWQPAEIKDAKQAEFLMEDSFPWSLVERIGVKSKAIQRRVADELASVSHRPICQIRRGWYY